jgi:hypothetical protein
MALGSYEYFDSKGNRLTGTIADGGSITAGTTDTKLETSNTVYSKVTIKGDADLAASNIANGVNILGVTGNAALKPIDCSSDGATGCVAVAGYPAVNTSLIASNVRKGFSLAGSSGDYPSATNPLDGASGIGLTTSNLDSKLSQNAQFEFWSSSGARQVANGNIKLNAANIRFGTNLFGQNGLIKTKCRNMANLNKYDRTSSDGSESVTSGLDFYDTIHFGLYSGNLVDGNFSNPFPLTDTDVQCGAELWKAEGTSLSDGNSIPCDSINDECVYTDKITRLSWGEYVDDGIDYPDWDEAIAFCDTLVFAGFSDWRLPTQIEMSQAYAHGINNLQSANFWSSLNKSFWTSTTYNDSGTTTKAFYSYLGYGGSAPSLKDNTNAGVTSVLCVRE